MYYLFVQVGDVPIPRRSFTQTWTGSAATSRKSLVQGLEMDVSYKYKLETRFVVISQLQTEEYFYCCMFRTLSCGG